jgi:hypothetical protein
MDDTQKHILLIAASILAASKLTALLDSKNSPSRDAVISEAVRDAKHLLQEIDRQHSATGE